MGAVNGPVWLVGAMGAGKSVVGHALAKRLGRRFVDTDTEIERAAGRTITEIFSSEGERGFRERERDAIESLCDADAIVALGGGAIAQPGIADRLAAAGRVVYLRASVETLLERIGDGARRPLLAGLDAAGRATRLTEILAQRESAYATAKLVVQTDGLDVPQVVDAIVAGLGDSRVAT